MDNNEQPSAYDNGARPLPWVADVNELIVVDVYGNVVADCDVETFVAERAANAELIALACNNYHKLVEALKRQVDVSAVACNLNETHCQIRADVWLEMCRASRRPRRLSAKPKRARNRHRCADQRMRLDDALGLVSNDRAGEFETVNQGEWGSCHAP